MASLAMTLSLLLLHNISNSNAAGILPQYGLWPQQDFLFDMCAPAKPGQQQKGPWPVRVNDLCSSFGLNDPTKTEQACEVVQLLKLMLATPAAAPLNCQPNAIPPPPQADSNGVLLPLPLPDLRGGSGSSGKLPSLLSTDQTAALLKAEGASHLWLYKHVQRLQAWTPCEAIGQQQPWQQPPGWQLLQLIPLINDLKGYKLDAKTLPFAAVLRQSSNPASRAACRRALQLQQQEHDAYVSASAAAASTAAAVPLTGGNDGVLRQHQLCSGDRLVILLRGTTSAFEWKYNLNYSMTTDASYGRGSIHTGFHTVTEQVWTGGLQQVLAQQVMGQQQLGQQGAAAPINNIIFAGHSLGGAAAALLAAKTHNFLSAARTPSPAAAASAVPLITSVTFGAPNVGDAAFAADFDARINARNIEYVADIVPQLPCAGHMPLCGAAAAAGGAGGAAGGSAAAAGGDADSTQSFGAGDDSSLGDDDDSLLDGEDAADAADFGDDGDDDAFSSSSSRRSSAGESVSYARLGGRLQLEAVDMPLQQDAWRQLSTYRQDDFCDNLQTMNALAQATHTCSYMCHLSHTAGQDRHWCMLWAAEAGGAPVGGAANATYCQHGRTSVYPMSPPFPPML